MDTSRLFFNDALLLCQIPVANVTTSDLPGGCGQVLEEFVTGVLVASRLYTDELLCACLDLLLSAPPSLVPVQAHVPACCWLISDFCIFHSP